MRRPTAAPGTPPSADDIADLAERALAGLPPAMARHVRGVGILVDEMPDDDLLAEMGIETPWELTGLYRGVPLPLQSHEDIARAPALIHLFRQPILLEWIETDEDLFRLVRSVLIHEIAHHFGFSDDDIAAIEGDAD